MSMRFSKNLAKILRSFKNLALSLINSALVLHYSYVIGFICWRPRGGLKVSSTSCRCLWKVPAGRRENPDSAVLRTFRTSVFFLFRFLQTVFYWH